MALDTKYRKKKIALDFGLRSRLPQALIFDVDGTLYDQAKLRTRMAWEILRVCVLRPQRLQDIRILSGFRKERERLASLEMDNLEVRQYLHVADSFGTTDENVHRIVREWIFEKPLHHMDACRFPGVSEVFAALRRRNVAIGVFSEYPSEVKLRALGVSADVLVCSTDKDVDRFKPDPKGLFVTAQKLGVPVHECLFIGDRDDKDGLCARRAEMPYLLLDRKNPAGPNRFGSFASLYEWIQAC